MFRDRRGIIRTSLRVIRRRVSNPAARRPRCNALTDPSHRLRPTGSRVRRSGAAGAASACLRGSGDRGSRRKRARIGTEPRPTRESGIAAIPRHAAPHSAGRMADRKRVWRYGVGDRAREAALGSPRPHGRRKRSTNAGLTHRLVRCGPGGFTSCSACTPSSDDPPTTTSPC